MISYTTDFFIRDPYPRKLYVYLFDRHVLTLYGHTAQRALRLLNMW